MKAFTNEPHDCRKDPFICRKIFSRLNSYDCFPKVSVSVLHHHGNSRDDNLSSTANRESCCHIRLVPFILRKPLHLYNRDGSSGAMIKKTLCYDSAFKTIVYSTDNVPVSSIKNSFVKTLKRDL